MMKYDRQVILSALQFDIADAYWISPSGMIRPVSTTHIDDVINHPVAFGFSEKFVKDIYEKHKEKLRLEGKARNELMEDLVLRGWIRIRYVRSHDYYSIDVNWLTKKTKEYLFEWALKILEFQPDHRNSDISLMVFSTGENYTYSLEDLTKAALFNRAERQELVLDYLIPLRMKDDFLDMGPVARMDKRIQEALIKQELKVLGFSDEDEILEADTKGDSEDLR